MGSSGRLFTARFFVMCGFTFTVFVSAFQLFPTAPYRIIDLGGSTATAGLFLGFLTYASALSAPVTGALADRIGKRRMLIVCSLALTGFSVAYGLTTDYRLPLVLALVHGVFWSGLLSAASAYMTDIFPPDRRAEGISYWGLSTVAAIAVAPTMGFWLYERGWGLLCGVMAALNLLMAGIAFGLKETTVATRLSHHPATGRALVEWRVLLGSLTLFLYSFGYGGLTSFVSLYADANGVAKGLYFQVLAVTILLTRLFTGRLADRFGTRRIFLPSLVLVVLGLAILAHAGTRPWLVASALVFGTGFGSAYPAYAAHVLRHVRDDRRGAAFGGILAAFDTGIGTGSIGMGLLVAHFGFETAFGFAALLAALAIPYFLVVGERLLRNPDTSQAPAG